MVKDFFKLEDFKNVINHNLTLSKDPAGMYASMANVIAVTNEKLQKLIESWPVVWFNDDKTMSPYWEASSRQDKSHTHKARLAFIEEIKKECVKHIPKIQSKQVASPMSDDPYAAALVLGCSIVCLNCGVELQATWSEKK